MCRLSHPKVQVLLNTPSVSWHLTRAAELNQTTPKAMADLSKDVLGIIDTVEVVLKRDYHAPCVHSRLWQTLLLQAIDVGPFAELLWHTLFARKACRNLSAS
jgi:hypothetical protein